MLVIFLICLIIWSGLTIWHCRRKGREWRAVVITSDMAIIFLYAFIDLYRRGASELRLGIVAVACVVIIFVEHALLGYLFAPSEAVARPAAAVQTPAAQLDFIALDLSEPAAETEAVTAVPPDNKYANVLKRCQSYEENGSYRLALRLYEDCIRNADNEQLIGQAEEGADRCKDMIAGKKRGA